jgi:FkbM family methyltransferase
MAIFLESLKEHGYLDALHLSIGVIGSRKLNDQDDYGQQEWHHFAPNLTIYGFDADEDACEIANADLAERSDINWVEKHIPLALGRSCGEQALYVTHEPMCSSLYPPNELFLSRFAGLNEMAGLDFELEVEIITLDHFCDTEAISNIDFLQIDVQGADLDVLKGAIHLLSRSVLAIQIEVEFAELYKGQPLFSDIDSFLRDQHFSLFDIEPRRIPRKCAPITSPQRSGQLLWGEAFYLRDLILVDSSLAQFQTPENLLKLVGIADILGFTDYALELLEHLMLRHELNDRYDFSAVIMDGFSKMEGMTQEDLSQLPVIQRILSTSGGKHFPSHG